MEIKKFAAFVMTYERPEIVARSIEILRTQVVAPEYILIIDNSKSQDTAILFEHTYAQNPQIAYYRVGYNSGPAGASKIGLEKLSELGYRWIYWGDDDNPPRDKWVFEQMFTKIDQLENSGVKLGIFGGKGGKFNKLTGRITSLKNKELKGKEVAEVDFVPGGQTMLVNTAIVKAGLLPEEKLFFSFEDLDICIKVKKAGYKIYVDAKTWYNIRKSYGNIRDSYKFKGTTFGKKDQLLRDYYSTRSILYILFNNSFYTAFFIQILKIGVKMLFGFKYGVGYGWQQIKFQKKAIQHFFENNYAFHEALNKSS